MRKEAVVRGKREGGEKKTNPRRGSSSGQDLNSNIQILLEMRTNSISNVTKTRNNQRLKQKRKKNKKREGKKIGRGEDKGKGTLTLRSSSSPLRLLRRSSII